MFLGCYHLLFFFFQQVPGDLLASASLALELQGCTITLSFLYFYMASGKCTQLLMLETEALH